MKSGTILGFAGAIGTALTIGACASGDETKDWRTMSGPGVTFQVPEGAEVEGLNATFDDYPVYRVADESYAMEMRFEPVPDQPRANVVVRDDVRLIKLHDEAPYERYALLTEEGFARPPVFAIHCKLRCPAEVWKIVASTSVKSAPDTSLPPPEGNYDEPRPTDYPPRIMTRPN